MRNALFLWDIATEWKNEDCVAKKNLIYHFMESMADRIDGRPTDIYIFHIIMAISQFFMLLFCYIAKNRCEFPLSLLDMM
jgi:hypothetical protein